MPRAVTIDRALANRFAAALNAVLGAPPVAEAPLALAVSGGPDSMAMLALAAAALPGCVVAASVDHGLRADAADECAMVARACGDLNVPHATLTAGAPPAGASLQAQARALRYRLLIDWAAAAGAPWLATAHQADDQAETFLMRAARGAGLSGLAGVRARRIAAATDGTAVTIVRPLLDWRRAELRAIVTSAGLPVVDDPANDDPRHDRTRFRRLLKAHEWLDVPHLARAASHLGEADDEMRGMAEWLWAERCVAGDEATVALALAGVPRGMRRRLVQRAIGAVREAAAITAPDWPAEGNVEPLLDALTAGRAATRAGVLGRAVGDVWHFRPAPPRRTQ